MSKPKSDNARQDQERFRQVAILFEKVVDLEPEERQEFLDRECADDPSLREEVDAMVKADTSDDSLFENPLSSAEVSIVADRGDQLELHSRVGSYEVLDLIAAGGMGRVYRAKRVDQQYEKLVAIKVIKRGMDTDEVIRRFLIERQTLANLDHANIARLFDGGITESGLPYIVMEYVEGMPIDAYCDQHSLSIDARLELFVRACSAVDYAHRNLVVHRDLKPGNILVDKDGNPKLLDFGIAKVLSPGGSSNTTALAEKGAHPMTPAYASPEQVRGEPITTACDVYSMGMVLYELLTGHRPYRLTTRSEMDIKRVICEKQPLPPSTAVRQIISIESTDNTTTTTTLTPDSVSGVRQSTPARLRRKLNGDLDNIVLMALRKEPRRRYASIREFSDDIHNYRTGLPVLALRDSLTYRAGKFVLRHRALSSLSTLMALTLLIGGLAFIRKAHIASIEGEKFKEIASFVQNMLASVRPEASGIDVTVREVLDEASAWMDTEFDDQPEVEAALRTTIGLSYQSLGIYDKSRNHLERAYELHRAPTMKGNIREQALSASHLASVLVDLGEYEDARRFYLEARRHHRTNGRTSPIDEVSILSGLSEIKGKGGDFKTAEQLAKEAHAISLTHHGPDHLITAKTLSHLASLQFACGSYAEADQNFSRAIEIEEKELGANDPRIASELNNWGVLKSRIHNAKEARPFLQRAVEIRRTNLAEDHPALAESLTALGSVLIALGERIDAERCFVEAIEINRKSLGSEHPALASSLNYLAVLKTSSREFEQAENLHEEALQILRRKFGSQHIRIATTLEHLGRIYRLRGSHTSPKAAETFREAHEMKRAILGPDHPDLESTLVALGGLHGGRGKIEEAHPYLKEVLRLRRLTLPEGHIKIAQALHQLGRNECDRLQFETGLILMRECCEIYAKAPDRPDSGHVESANQGTDLFSTLARISLGELLIHNELFEEAEATIHPAYEKLVELQGWNHINVQVQLRLVADAYKKENRSVEAGKYFSLLEQAKASAGSATRRR